MIDLNRKVVLVTGGSRGIGAGIVAGLLAANAEVIVHFNQGKEEARKLADGPEADRCHLVQADFYDPKAPLELWEQALAWQGKVDVLINNAAIRVSCGFEESFESLDQAWNDSMRVNAIAPAHLCRLATRHWKENHIDHGIIINLSSRPAYRGDRPHYYHDGASKAALSSLSYAMARFCAEDEVTVFTVVPGIILTGQVEGYQSHYGLESALDEIPLKEFGKPEDIAKVVTFLASGDAWYATGSTIDINGASYIH